MALVSPGVEVSVIDESVYAPTAASTVPLVLLATAENKVNPQGLLAEGTLKENAGSLYLLTSQRDVVNFFGTPSFYTNAGNSPLHGYELNEYGLQTAYSVLGTTSRVYALRADVDLGQLVGKIGRPQADPADGTYWLDLNSTRWGIFEWDAADQAFESRTPFVYVSADDLDAGVPKASKGTIGSYAIVGTNSALPLYFKNKYNEWVLVGSNDWLDTVPALYSKSANPTINAGESIEINSIIVTMTGTTVVTAANDINNAAIPGVRAEAEDGRLLFFVSATELEIRNDSGTVLNDIGITAGFFNRPVAKMQPHTQVPNWKTSGVPHPTGSIWIKTTAVNAGASFSVKRYNELTDTWQVLSAPLYENDQSANTAIDPLRGGLGVSVGSTYVQHDVQENETVTYKIFERATTGETAVTGAVTSPTFQFGDSFTVKYSVPGANGLTTATTVTMSGTTADTFVADVLAKGMSYVGARIEANGAITIYHSAGGVIVLAEATGTPLADAGISSAADFARNGNNGEIIISNWIAAAVEVSTVNPGTIPSDSTMWYWSVADEADIMVHNGQNWVGYQNLTNDARGFNLSNTDPNGPIFAASMPETKTDGNPLSYGDLWIDTADLENYPKLYRYEFVRGENKFVEIDLADQTTENGILFADARFMGDSSSDVNDDAITSIKELLINDYVDLDAPDPALYPAGMLLWNTRRSGFNVKVYRKNYFNYDNFPGQILPTETNAWVSISGKRNNGHAYFGRKAQRSVISAAMKEAIDANTEIREELREFNLIAAPGYPELVPNMIELNNDRKQTAFVIGDSSMRIPTEGTDLIDWLQNTDINSAEDEKLLASADPYTGVWYPALLGNDLTGNSIAMPSSYGVLRMMLRNDQVSYPWFAPAGLRRGIIDNASRVGYLTETSEFVNVGVRQGIRDVLYENAVNPITQTPSTGIVAFGQKTRSPFASSMDRVNVARLVVYIRTQLDKIVRPFLFEPNDKLTRDEVKYVVDSFFNDLITKRALYDYLVVCDESNNTPDRIDRNELYIDVAIEPVKAIEFIYIPVRIQNTGSIGGV